MARKPKNARSAADLAHKPADPPGSSKNGEPGSAEDSFPAKDSRELELETLVFGDDEGFQEELREYNDQLEQFLPSDNEVVEGEEDHVSSDEGGLEGLDDAELFFIDSGAPGQAKQENAVVSQQEVTEDGETPAWVDSDDDRIAVSLASQPRLRKLRNFEGEDVITGREYTRRLQQQFERLYPVPEWAKEKPGHRRKRRRTSQSGSSEDEVDPDSMDLDEGEDVSTQSLAELLRSNESLTAIAKTSEGRRQLREGTIDIQRTKDVSGSQPSSILSLNFHPAYPILISSGPSSLLNLHHISPSAPAPNPLLTKVAIPRNPIETSAIHPDGKRIFIGGRRRYFHIWNLDDGKVARVTRIYGHADEQRTFEKFKISPCGRYVGFVGSGRKGGGFVNVLNADTLQWICQARVESEGGVADFAWWANGEGLVVLGIGGQAIEYSIKESRVIAKWQDQGANGTTCVAMGGKVKGRASSLGGDRWMAVGSRSGFVNIYDRGSWTLDNLAPRPSPEKAMEQLVTATSHLHFSPDGQILVMASKGKRDALRLVHLPSCTVYKNWPTSGTPFGRITSVAWGAGGSLLAVANEQGKIRLWEVRD